MSLPPYRQLRQVCRVILILRTLRDPLHRTESALNLANYSVLFIALTMFLEQCYASIGSRVMETIRFFTLPRLFELFALPFLTKAFSQSTPPLAQGSFIPLLRQTLPSLSNSTTPINPQQTHENSRNCLDLTALNARTYTAIYLPPDNILRYYSAEGKPNMHNYLIPLDSHTQPSLSPITTAPDVCNYPPDVFSRCPSSPLLQTKLVPTLHHHHQLLKTIIQTLKAIISGVVRGFILPIVVAAIYRSRRLREPEDTAHPFIRILGRNEIRSDASRSRSDERQHFVPFPAPISPHHGSTSSSTVLGVTPLDFSRVSNHHQSDMNLDQRRAERQHQLNHL
ncbi:hypothetical protein Agabi119p4_9035 [Agaricus bisporus var. burnettii]|uniref:Uncharacterized protein n=1 Tax=Agaricus bisporus var. burnettii TaxID=192524 RepID=A0A8H7C554_AGABI|nr:hypothetical protein Agabi119p4_9035 [Agaricus bisporus var. burnettii]